ncbi:MULTISPECIES: LuxR C-terminal-related transcriptional regulator [unclassified Nocardioides]|uniref:LuxR C-terminal-related transcriptional regulator n=1 Tax=unclassified Nocardioides TaxID=2615069 RepID=UPI0000570385|nr:MULTISPECIES: LuxR C-terminal-related transcriptional regulator [unclassified Nocardioides]ABL83843.1 Helix-turn-helix, type 11 domain protein [Nocardioides sp. JS614]
MARSEPTTVLTALGFSPAVERTYERVVRHSGQRLPFVAAAVLRTPEQLLADLEPLIDRGIVQVEDERVHVEAPARALARLIVELSATASQAHADVAQLARAVPLLVAGAARPAEGEVHDVRPIDGEISSGGHPGPLITALIQHSKGDLAWLRPDQWRVHREGRMLEVVRDLVASGRRSRAIYPVRVLREAPEVVRARAAVGEEIRVLPDVPTRMFVIGTTHAVVPEPLGFVDEPRTLVRQQGLVEALALLFEMLWERASTVPELEQGEPRSDLRRFLLQQLATGAQDELIARKLGLSLRTVRRRVAGLMSELGADSRFQAGVEAVRRGWL